MSLRQAGGRPDPAGAASNLALTTLARVIKARSGLSGHVPYRDDALTLLLRPFLEGSAAATLLACVSPSSADAAETLATLR